MLFTALLQKSLRISISATSTLAFARLSVGAEGAATETAVSPKISAITPSSVRFNFPALLKPEDLSKLEVGGPGAR